MRETVLVYGLSRERRRQVQRVLVAGEFRVLLASSMAEGAKCLAQTGVDLIVVSESDAAAVDEVGALCAADLTRAQRDRTGEGNPVRLLRLADAIDSNDVLAPVRAALAG